MNRLPSLVVLAALCIACTGHADSAAKLKRPDRSTIATLQKRIPELLEQSTVPGLSIALIRNGKTYWVHGFGVRDASTKEPVDEQTIFGAASLGKPVFAYGVLKLVEQGKLDLDAPLTRYLPKPYIEGDPRLELITARLVLSHRTGFPNWRGDGEPLKIYFTPGERFSYSGEGMVYLARAVEQITGKPINDYLTEAVFEPLGMTSSSYDWRAGFDARAATPHDVDGKPGEKEKAGEINIAGSLHTTAGDYALFIEALMNGRGLKRATIEELEKPQIALDPNCSNCTDQAPKETSKNLFWGLGMGIQQTAQGKSLWHWGDRGQFKAYVVAYPKEKIGVVMFANGENGLSIASEIVRDAIGSDDLGLRWLKYQSYDSAGMQFAKAAREKGTVAAIAQFRAELSSGEIPENSINALGYRALGLKQMPDALAIFQLNSELHPNSWNAYDSLGEALMNNGDKAQAIKSYEKSLELNPKNSNGAEMLKKLNKN